MAKSNGLTHILAELLPLDELSVLTARSARLKYTCLSVSRKYVALGSNTGGVYIFSRDTLKYLQVVFADTESSPVVCVSLPSSDQYVAFALSTGLVAVFELNIDKRTKPERIRNTQDHSGHLVNSMTWDTTCSKLFVGDNTGKLSIVYVSSVKGKTLFAGPSEVIAYLPSSICQLEWWKDKLLVSTVTHTHLFDTLKHNYSTIGTKSRDGEFGACFFLEPSSQVPVVYCARPGSRMWEVDFEGKVLNTHQFKQLLAIPSVPVIKLWEEQLESINSGKTTSQSVNFFKMLRVGQFIVTWSLKGVYIFDPINVKVVVWTESFKGIKDISVINNDIYLFLEKTEVHKLSLLPVYQLFTVLSLRKRWSLMSSLLLLSDIFNIRPAIMKRVNQDLLQTLLTGLKEEGKFDVVEKVRASMEDLSEGSIESLGAYDDFMDTAEVMGYTYLSSGMVVVSEGVQIRDFMPRTGDKSDVVQKTSDVFESQNIGIERVYTEKYNGEVDCDNIKKEDAECTLEENNDIVKNENNDSAFRQLIDENEVGSDLVENCDAKISDSTIEINVQENFQQRGQMKTLQSKDTSFFDSSVTNGEHKHTGVEQASCDLDIRDSKFPVNEFDAVEKLNSDSRVEILKTCTDYQVNSSSHEFTTSDIEDGDNCRVVSQVSGGDICHRQEFTISDIYVGNNCKGLNQVICKDDILRQKFATSDIYDGNNCKDFSHVSSKDNSASPNQNNSFGIDLKMDQTVQLENNLCNETGVLEAEDTQRDMAEDGKMNLDELRRNKVMDPQSALVKIESENIKDSSHFLSISPSVATDKNKNLKNTPSLYPPEEFIFGNEEICHSSSQTDWPELSGEGTVTEDESSSSAVAFSEHNSENVRSMNPAIEECNASNPKLLSSVDLPNDLNEISKDPTKPTISDEIQHVVSPHLARIGENKINVLKRDARRPTKKFFQIDFPNTQDDVIAQPLRTGKKRKTKKISENKTRSTSLDTYSHDNKKGSLRSTISVGDEPDDMFFDDIVGDFDAVSVTTISSIEEEDDVMLPGPVTPDSLSLGGDSYCKADNRKSSFEYSVSPPGFRDKSLVRKNSATLSYTEAKEEVIPPLIDRLAAARGAHSSDDLSVGVRDSPPNSSSLVGENAFSVGSPKTSLSTFTDGFSHLKSQTKSFIKTIKEKNILMTKSTSSPMLSSLTQQQQIPLKDDTNSLEQMEDHDNTAKTNREGNEKMKEAEVANLDIAMLCQTARDIQKTLSDPTTLLNPRLLVRVLNEWARELNGVMVAYHLQLNQMQHEQSKQDEKSTSSGNETYSEAKDHQSSTKNSEISDQDTTNCSCGNEIVPCASCDNSSSAYRESSPAQSYDSSVACLTTKYWSSIIHLKDPFHIPVQQLELVKTLTTLCFISGATGNILNFLGFTKEAHMNELLKSFLPPTLFSSYSPLSETFSMRTHCLLNSSSHLESPSNKQFDIEDSGSKILTNTSAVLKKDADISTFEDIETHLDVNGANNPKTSSSHDETLRAGEEKLNTLNLNTTEVDPNPTESFDVSNVQCGQSLLTGPKIERDLSLALFTRLYFFAFDYERLKQELDYQETNLFLTWASFLKCSREKGSENIVGTILSDKQFKSAFDYLRSGILPQQSALLGHIYELMVQVPAKTSEFCGELCKQVTINDLLCLCALCSKPAYDCLLRYVRQVMIDLATAQRSEVFSQLFKKNKNTRYIFLEALLPSLAQGVTSFQTSKSIASQVLSVLPSDWLNIILSMINSDEEREDIVTLSINAEYWPITVKLLSQSNQWQRLLQLIVEIDDLRLLTGNNGEEAYIPKNLEEWKYFLECYAEKHSADAYHTKSESLEPEHSIDVLQNDNSELSYESFRTPGTKRPSYLGEAITWNSLGNILLKYVGGAFTIELLMNYLKDQEMTKNCLSTEFLNACYVDFSLKMKQDHLTHEMLEKLSAYMWAKKPDFVPPSVFNAITSESSMTEKGDGDVDALQILFNQVQSLDIRELMSENLGGHWGQEVDISSPCLLCNIQLKSVVSLTVQGVVVFPCKHAFHKCCVSGPTCPVLH